jgi:HTH-type transcriptional regulator/antitoxin HigA
MEIKPIKTENDYNNSIKRIEALWGAKKDSIEGDELDLLCTLVESYEMHHYPIAPPDPIDAIQFRMEQMGMTKTDMAKYLGAQSRVSEVLSRKRQLTLKMVKSLYNDLKIPADILLSNKNSAVQHSVPSDI